MVLLAALAGFSRRAAVAQDIHLKTRDIRTDSAAERTLPGRRGLTTFRRTPAHQIIQFDHPPGADDLANMITAGYKVVGAAPDNAVVAVVPPRSNASTDLPGVRWGGPLQAEDKLSPALMGSIDATGNGDIGAVIEFHPDVTVEAQDNVAQAIGLKFFRPAYLLASHVVVSTKPDDLRALAGRDEVAYIFPADPAMLDAGGDAGQSLACAGMLTLAGPVGQYVNVVHGWQVDADHGAHLGYYFGALGLKVPQAIVQAEILRAMTAWAAVANVTFSAAAAESDAHTVAIQFVSHSHGDAYPFDGAGGILAHTFYPVPVNAESIAGDIHLDADENWHAGSDLDIYSVVLHELGHAIGLAHSDKPGDVMYPYYKRGMQLSANDIGAARALYGIAAPSVPETQLSGPVPVTTPLPGPAIPALALTLNPLPPAVTSGEVSLSGIVSGGIAPLVVQYQTDHGSAGNATISSTGNWTAARVPLVPGNNTITVTALDGAGSVANQSATVTRVALSTPASSPVSVRITSPAASVTASAAAVISLAGTASGGAGIVQVTWQTSTGKSGNAIGTERWVAQSIPLLNGTNTIVVRAWDANGGSAWATEVVVH